MFRFVILFMALFALTCATKVNECTKTEGALPIAVRISGCDEPPCAVIKGQETAVDIDFANALDEEATILQTKVKATALGVTIMYPLPEKYANVCENLANGQECPLDSGEDATYNFLFPIGQYPPIGVNLEIYLENQNEEIVTCFSVDIKVEKSN